MSRAPTPSNAAYWSGGSTPVLNQHDGAAFASTSLSSATDDVGVTRSRTLLFLSYRDSVPRSGPTRRRQPGSRLVTNNDGSDPLGATSSSASRKGKGKAVNDNGGIYFDFDDDAEEVDEGGHNEEQRGAEEQESASLLPTRRDHSVIDVPTLPPKWVDASDQIDSILSGLVPQISSLDRMQAKHLLPGFVDRSAEERDIARLQGEITREFSRCSKMIATLAADLKRQTKGAGPQGRGGGTMSKEEVILARNVQTALAQRVQSASGQFRKKQSNYMQRLRGQDVRHREVMGELGLAPKGSSNAATRGSSGGASGGGMMSAGGGAEELAAREDMELSRAQLSRGSEGKQYQQQQQILLLQEEEGQNTQVEDYAQRNAEITQIASSILELSQLFQDLQTLVIDQGSLVDRIDYNIETMAKDMEKADVELKIASSTQRRTGKGQCILFLVLLCALLIVVIIVKPFFR